MNHLGKFFREPRIEKGMSLRQLAAILGYANLNKGSNRIQKFESGGKVAHGVQSVDSRRLGGKLAIVSNTFYAYWLGARKLNVSQSLVDLMEQETEVGPHRGGAPKPLRFELRDFAKWHACT